MKQAFSTQLALYRLMAAGFFLLFCLSKASGQQLVLTDTISGPYEDYPGPYYVRVFVNFVQRSTEQWTSNYNLQAEADAVMTALNAAFNEHKIYFVPYSDPCSSSTFELYTTNLNVTQIRDQLQNSNALNSALHIYVTDDDNFYGWAFYIPNNFCEIYGQRNGVLVTRTEVLVHEVGHNLGLVHTHEGCAETPGACGSEEPCNCCGDYVCDTAPHSNSGIFANTNCGHDTLPDHIVKNYMSYTEPGDCRDRFTLEQAKRARAYLEESAVLQGAQIKAVKIPGGTVTSPSGNIVVESGELCESRVEK